MRFLEKGARDPRKILRKGIGENGRERKIVSSVIRVRVDECAKATYPGLEDDVSVSRSACFSPQNLPPLVQSCTPTLLGKADRDSFFTVRHLTSEPSSLGEMRARLTITQMVHKSRVYVHAWTRRQRTHTHTHTRHTSYIRPPWPILYARRTERHASACARKSYGATGRLQPGASPL